MIYMKFNIHQSPNIWPDTTKTLLKPLTDKQVSFIIISYKFLSEFVAGWLTCLAINQVAMDIIG